MNAEPIVLETRSTDDGEEFWISGRGRTVGTMCWRTRDMVLARRLKPGELPVYRSWDSIRGYGDRWDDSDEWPTSLDEDLLHAVEAITKGTSMDEHDKQISDDEIEAALAPPVGTIPPSERIVVGDDTRQLLDAVPEAALCKIDGCENRWATQKGPYGRLCVTHKREAQELNKKPRRQKAEKPTLAEELVAQVRAEKPAVEEADRVDAAANGFAEAMARLQEAHDQVMTAEEALDNARLNLRDAYDDLAPWAAS